MTGCWGEASQESADWSSRTVRKPGRRGFGVGSTVSHADDASSPRARGTATRNTGGSGHGGAHGEFGEESGTPAAAIEAGDQVEMEFVPPLTQMHGLTMRGTPRPKSYFQNVTGGWIALGLKPGNVWPSFGHDGDGTTLFLSSLKINGGFNILEGPVPVAKVIPAPSVVNGEEKLIYSTQKDGSTVTCDDSCAWALDGVCDDGSKGPSGQKSGKGLAGKKGRVSGTMGGGREQDDDAGEYDDGEYGYAYDDEYDNDGEEIYDDERFLEQEGGYEYGDEYAYGYEEFYDDEEGGEDSYGYYGDDWGAPACAAGTDCSDCGGPLGEDGAIKSTYGDDGGDFDDDEWFDDKDGDWQDDDDYDFGEDWDGYHDDGEADVLGFISSVKPTKGVHARHSGDHTQTHWWHRRRQKNGEEMTALQKAERAGYWMGLVAVAFFILIGYAYHTKLSDEERKDKCAPCRAALLTVTSRDTAAMDEAEQALGLKSAKD